MKIVPRSDVSFSANIIGSHVIYRRKPDGSVKARIVPWRNHDKEKLGLRTDAPCMSMETFRLIISLAVENNWELCEMDVAAAFLQAKNFNRVVFVRPPKEENSTGFLWQLTKAAYGLVDSPRLWFLTSEDSLIREFCLSKSKLEPTLYYSKSDDNQLDFVLVVQVDNYIYSGTAQSIASFESFLNNKFHIGELKHKSFKLYGSEITQLDDGSITLTQNAKLSDLDENELFIEHAEHSGDSPATPEQITAYQSALGKLLFIGQLSQPVALYYASHMATKINSLRMSHLKDLRALVRVVRKSNPTLLFNRPISNAPFHLDVLTDAAMSNKNSTGARGGLLIFRRSGDVVHPIHWQSRKLRRVARSSSTAEIIAAADGTDFALHLQNLIAEFTGYLDAELPINPPFELRIDSRCLFNLITTIKQPEEAMNRADLAIIREAFATGRLQAVNWTPGYYLIVDALTKDNRTSAAHLLKALREGIYPKHPATISRLAPDGEELHLLHENKHHY